MTAVERLNKECNRAQTNLALLNQFGIPSAAFSPNIADAVLLENLRAVHAQMRQELLAENVVASQASILIARWDRSHGL